uniref:Uncharacterized protein n=1 Tax=Pararge aegeria TaxID=116150 RepID=S4PLF2_9NEOP
MSLCTCVATRQYSRLSQTREIGACSKQRICQATNFSTLPTNSLRSNRSLLLRVVDDIFIQNREKNHKKI